MSYTANRYLGNPILKPDPANSWEKDAAFNPCIAKDEAGYHLVYRAIGEATIDNKTLSLSTIGYAQSQNGVIFQNHKQLIKPETDWDKYGCEDPRITKFEDKFYIFYTAISAFPPSADNIKIGVALTTDFQNFERHPVTHFNSKAMAIFPERINGKIAALLTVNTDRPPSKIALALFDDESQIWSRVYWDKWLDSLDQNILSLQRTLEDHIEVGAPPVKTDSGWLFIHSYIHNYLGPGKRVFGVEAVLLDLNNPLKILGRTQEPLIVPEKDYELHGNVPDIVFPSGAILCNCDLSIYYGAADTSGCLVKFDTEELIMSILPQKKAIFLVGQQKIVKLARYEGNPIILPEPKHDWESQSAFNAGALYENGIIHILYRALSQDNVSVLGYASSEDGFRLRDRFDVPVYLARESFEQRTGPGNTGCEDPRLTKIDDKIYMCYTATDGYHPWRVALTSIDTQDFINHHWNWKRPILISKPGIGDKNACVFPEKIMGKYAVFHRIEPCIWLDFVDDLEFQGNIWLEGSVVLRPRAESWDSRKVGIGPVPIKTADGWLLIYHGNSERDHHYRLGAALLDLEDPRMVTARCDYPILEPETIYEKAGTRPGTVFSCGAVVINEELLVYYGAADQSLCVATGNLNEIVNEVKNHKAF